MLLFKHQAIEIELSALVIILIMSLTASLALCL